MQTCEAEQGWVGSVEVVKTGLFDGCWNGEFWGSWARVPQKMSFGGLMMTPASVEVLLDLHCKPKKPSGVPIVCG